jgi:hypothetical protein
MRDAADDFNRPNQNPIGGHWTTMPGASPVQITGNQAGSTATTNNGAFWNEPCSKDQWASCTSNLGDGGPAVRISTSGSTLNCYMIAMYTDHWNCQKIVGGVFTSIIANTYQTMTTSTEASITVVGSLICCYINEVLVGSVTDTDLTSGQPGIFAYDGAGTFRWDGWSAGEILPFPVVPITDTFTGTDGTSPPSADWTNSNGALEIRSNTCGGTNAAGWNIGIRNNLSRPITSPNFLEVYTTITTLPANGEYILFGLSDPSGNGYFLRFLESTAGNDTFDLWLMASWSYSTQVGSSNSSYNFAAGDALGLRMVGHDFFVWRKPIGGSWAQVAFFSDATYSYCQTVSLWINNTTTRVDDFGAGSLIQSGPFPEYRPDFAM